MKNEKNVQPKVVTITNILALFNKKKVEIQNFVILLLKVGQHFKH